MGLSGDLVCIDSFRLVEMQFCCMQPHAGKAPLRFHAAPADKDVSVLASFDGRRTRQRALRCLAVESRDGENDRRPVVSLFRCPVVRNQFEANNWRSVFSLLRTQQGASKVFCNISRWIHPSSKALRFASLLGYGRRSRVLSPECNPPVFCAGMAFYHLFTLHYFWGPNKCCPVYCSFCFLFVFRVLPKDRIRVSHKTPIFWRHTELCFWFWMASLNNIFYLYSSPHLDTLSEHETYFLSAFGKTN